MRRGGRESCWAWIHRKPKQIIAVARELRLPRIRPEDPLHLARELEDLGLPNERRNIPTIRIRE
jgi:hypothetical protein